MSRKKLTQRICPSDGGAPHYVLQPSSEAVNGKIYGVCKKCQEQSPRWLAAHSLRETPSVFSVNSRVALKPK